MYASYNHDTMPQIQPLDALTKNDDGNRFPFDDDSDSDRVPELRLMKAVSRRMHKYVEKRSGRIGSSKKPGIP